MIERRFKRLKAIKLNKLHNTPETLAKSVTELKVFKKMLLKSTIGRTSHWPIILQQNYVLESFLKI